MTIIVLFSFEVGISGEGDISTKYYYRLHPHLSINEEIW